MAVGFRDPRAAVSAEMLDLDLPWAGETLPEGLFYPPCCW